jgi:DnaJ-class molecular chaperone
MEVQDYYKTLGVQRNASQAEIKKAFRKLARESHPDKHPGDSGAERRFKEINEANAVLSDPKKREKYDRFGRDWEAYARAGAAAGGAGAAGGARGGDPFGPGGPFAGYTGFSSGGGQGGGIRYEFRTTGGGDGGAFSDFFRMMFGDESDAAGEPRARGGGSGSMEDILSGMRFSGSTAGATGRGANGRPAAARLAPVEAMADVSLEEGFHGTSRIVELDGRRLEVKIPRGVDTGSRVRLSGKGPDGRDLEVVIRVRPHRTFTRKGDDLERELPVTLREALLGAEVPVATLKGRVLLKLPAGTQNGRSFRLKGQGMPRFKGEGAGDLYARVRVVLPNDLSDRAKEAAEQFLDLVHQPDPRA